MFTLLFLLGFFFLVYISLTVFVISVGVGVVWEIVVLVLKDLYIPALGSGYTFSKS